MKVRYIIPTMAVHDGLKYCIESIKNSHKLLSFNEYEIVVVTENRDYSDDSVKVVLCKNGTNFTEKINAGLWDVINRKSDCDVVCFLNDDVVLFPKSLRMMLHNLEYKIIDMMNPYSNCDFGWLYNENIILGDGNELGVGLPIDWMTEERMKFLQVYSEDCCRDNEIKYTEHIAFFCTFIKTEVIMKLGYLDESMQVIGSDFEYCDRAASHGYKIGWNDGAFVFHFGAVSRKHCEKVDRKTYHELDKKDNEVYNRKKKKKVLIVSGKSWENWNIDNLYTGGIGGSETCLLYLARYLVKNGYDVTAVIDSKEESSVRDGVHYVSVLYPFSVEKHYDFAICSRVPYMYEMVKDISDKVVLWCHDITYTNQDEIKSAGKFDNIILLSTWHRSFWKQFSFDDRVIVIPDGIDTERFNPDIHHEYGKVVYGSSWDRGLDNLIYICSEVRKRTRTDKLKLHIFYGIYNLVRFANSVNDRKLLAFVEYIKSLINENDWIIDHGRVNQNTLAKQYSSAFAWVYPTYFHETCCITAMEAMAAGLPIVHNALAGLERFKDTGAVIVGNCESIFYHRKDLERFEPYIESLANIMTDPVLWKRLHKKSIATAAKYSWQRVVKECWVPLIEGEKCLTL